MSERVKGILGSVVILGCFALLGYLVHEKVDGATVAALATVTTIVAWFTQRPSGGPPPGVVVIAGVVTAWALIACGATHDRALAAEQAYREQQRDCLRQYQRVEDRRACVRRVRDDWGGFVDAEDGGAP